MLTTADQQKLQALALSVLDIEANAIIALKPRIDAAFVKACELILDCQGRLVVIGMGKSGHIGEKIAATLASTGTPAFFVHPGEASHGDMGMITATDVVMLISYSGQTQELLTLIPAIKRLHVPVVSLTGNPQSTLATAADVHLSIAVSQEACPLGLAPTASTTATLAMGDAIAVALLEARGFTPEDFARSHPAGALGRKLLLKVSDIMHKDAQLPKVSLETTISDALLEMSAKHLGMTAVVDSNDHVLGIFTDGDLRRALRKELNIHQEKVKDNMTTPCETIDANMLAVEALNLMQDKKINALLVTDAQQQLIGAFNMHDLLRAQVI
jgi:arabinose-5-phosphate isomerase